MSKVYVRIGIDRNTSVLEFGKLVESLKGNDLITSVDVFSKYSKKSILENFETEPCFYYGPEFH